MCRLCASGFSRPTPSAHCKRRVFSTSSLISRISYSLPCAFAAWMSVKQSMQVEKSATSPKTPNREPSYFHSVLKMRLQVLSSVENGYLMSFLRTYVHLELFERQGRRPKIEAVLDRRPSGQPRRTNGKSNRKAASSNHQTNHLTIRNARVCQK